MIRVFDRQITKPVATLFVPPLNIISNISYVLKVKTLTLFLSSISKPQVWRKNNSKFDKTNGGKRCILPSSIILEIYVLLYKVKMKAINSTGLNYSKHC